MRLRIWGFTLINLNHLTFFQSNFIQIWSKSLSRTHGCLVGILPRLKSTAE